MDADRNTLSLSHLPVFLGAAAAPADHSGWPAGRFALTGAKARHAAFSPRYVMRGGQIRVSASRLSRIVWVTG